MQQRALVLTMNAEEEEKIARIKLDFKQRMIAAHPESAEMIEELFDETYAPKLSEEELAQVGKMGVDEIEEALGDLGKLGISIR